jgi:hypothetical protein
MKKKKVWLLILAVFFLTSFNSVKAGTPLDLGLSEEMIKEYLRKKDPEQNLVPVGVLKIPCCGATIICVPFVTFEKSKEYKKIRNMQPRDLNPNDIKARVILKNRSLEKFEVKIDNIWTLVYPKPKEKEKKQRPFPQHFS